MDPSLRKTANKLEIPQPLNQGTVTVLVSVIWSPVSLWLLPIPHLVGSILHCNPIDHLNCEQGELGRSCLSSRLVIRGRGVPPAVMFVNVLPA